MTISNIQPSFARGEVGPEIAARTDLAAYQTGLAKCSNFIVSPYGGILNRAGTEFLSTTPSNEIARLIRFKFSFSDTYALEFTHLKMRLYRDGGLVVYSSGPNVGLPFELVTPYTRDELFALRFVQSADVMDIVHLNHKPALLKRFAHDNWTLTDVSLVPSIAAPASATATYSGGGSSGPVLPWRYQITAVIDNGADTEESLPVTSNSINVFTSAPIAQVVWPAVVGASYYNVYKDNAGAGVYGFVGRASSLLFVDNNIAPTKTDTPPTGLDPFIGAGNYPRTVSYFQQRKVYAGTTLQPQTMWFSRTGVFSNFGYSFPTKDDDAITWTMASNEVNQINHLAPFKTLITLTDGAEWLISGQAGGFTAKTINGDPTTYNGIGQLRPLVLDNNVVYAQERGRSVTSFGYSLQYDGFSGSDISILSPQMLQSYSLVDWDFQKVPYSIVWGCLTDGSMVGITYLQEQQVIAWHRHNTDGDVKSVCSVPEGRHDSIYLCVERIVGGVPVRYIERMAQRQLLRYNDLPLINYSWFVDCGLQYDGSNTSNETMTLTGGTLWQSPEELTLTSSNASRFVVGDVGDDVQYLVTPGAEPMRLGIISYVSGAVVKVRPEGVVPTAIRGTPFTNWSFARDTLSGLGHLEGRKVVCLADGNVVNDLTVTSGSISLDVPAGIVTVGLPYESEAQTLEPNVAGQETLADKTKIIRRVTAILLESRGGWYGRANAPDQMWEFKPREDADEYGAIQARSGEVSQTITDRWSGNGQVTVVQKDPLPLQVLALIPQLDTGGRK